MPVPVGGGENRWWERVSGTLVARWWHVGELVGVACWGIVVVIGAVG